MPTRRVWRRKAVIRVEIAKRDLASHMRSVIVYHDLRKMGSHPDEDDAQVRPSRLLVLFPFPCQLVVTAILVKA